MPQRVVRLRTILKRSEQQREWLTRDDIRSLMDYIASLLRKETADISEDEWELIREVNLTLGNYTL